MKVNFNCNMSLWLDNVEVEGKDVAICKQKFLNMTLEELLEKGATVKSTDITDIDYEITHNDYTVSVYDIVPEEKTTIKYPSHLFITLENVKEDEIESEIEDYLLSTYHFCVESFSYEIV